jgi:RNA polymerase sigma-70 factor (ECF subfamily)
MASEQAEEVGRALSALPPEQRVLVELSFLHGYSQSEIATILSLPLGTVKARILRGLTRLRTSLEPLHIHGDVNDGDNS